MSEEHLTKIIELLEKLLNSNSNTIAIWSIIIAILALVVTIIFNIITHRQYIKSLDPLLSFELFAFEGLLVLSVTNTGKSQANNITIDIEELDNNGKEKKLNYGIFKKEITLFPNEKTQGFIAVSGRETEKNVSTKNIAQRDLTDNQQKTNENTHLISTSNKNLETAIFPIIKATVKYAMGNRHKKVSYKRTITFTEISKDFSDMRYIGEKLNELSHSVVRVANYVEGRFLFASDTINVVPNSTLYRDMKDIYNKVERPQGERPTLTEELDNLLYSKTNTKTKKETNTPKS